MPYINIDAPAKINLRLKVVGRRDDGYHLLSMLNEKLTLVDKIRVQTDGTPERYKKDFQIRLRCKNAPALETPNNLVEKAARVMAEKYAVSTPLTIEIEKNIPIGAGLGGGSSDAAACLMALNKLWGLYKPPEELAKIGVTIGADVPFFFYTGPAWVTGIGEVVDPDVCLPKLWVLLVNPGFQVSTKWVYQSFDTSTAPNPIIQDGDQTPFSINPGHTLAFRPEGRRVDLELTQGIEDDRFRPIFNNLDDLCPVVENDLEQVVHKTHPEISEIKSFLADRRARIVFMSGSGPTIVGIFESKRDRDSAVLDLANSNWKFFLTENFWHRR